MDENKRFFNKPTILITVICILITSVTGMFILKSKSRNNSYIVKSENNYFIEKELDSVELGVYNKDVYGLININTADKETLMLLTGIGDKKADAIIEYRKNHPFKSTNEIMNINGIGNAIFKEIKDIICVE